MSLRVIFLIAAVLLWGRSLGAQDQQNAAVAEASGRGASEAVTVTGTAADAAAEDAPGAAAEASDIEVVVTASRVEEESARVPAHLSVIHAEELLASGQTSIVEALDALAGVHFRSFSGNAAQAEVSLRGFGSNSHGRVLVLMDGRRLNRPYMAGVNWLEFPMENVERIEVVRGGNSVLYGDHAVAGVINIITKRGAEDLVITASGLAGSFGLNQERVGVSGSAGPLRFSTSAERTATDGYRDRTAYRSLGVAANVGLDLGPLVSTDLSLSYNNLFYEMPGSLTKEEMEADPTEAGNPEDESKGQHADVNLRLAVGPGDSWLVDTSLLYGLKFIQRDMTSWVSFSDQVLHTLGATPRLILQFDLLGRPNRWIIGSDAYYDLLNLKKYGDKGRDSSTLETKVGKFSLGFYSQEELALWEWLSATAGLRYELAEIAAETVKTAGSPIDDRKYHQALVYNFGLLLQPLRNSKIYTRYGTIYRYPFVDEQVSMYGFGTDAFNADLEAEKGYNLEAGAEAGLWGALTLGGNFFFLDMQDEIAYNRDTGRNENLDKTRHWGVEAVARLSLENLLELSASYTYTKAIFIAGANKNKEIPLVPNHDAAAETTFYLPLGFALGGRANYVGEAYIDNDNTLSRLNDYLLFDLFLRYLPPYLPGRLEVFLGMDNVFDTRYAGMAFPGDAYYPGMGRSWKIGASYRY